MTLWRSFLAVAESFLDLCRRLVVDTQEPMAAAHAWRTKETSQVAPRGVSTQNPGMDIYWPHSEELKGQIKEL
jgi:hypothetical protein